MPSRALDVLGRLAEDSYGFVFGEVQPVDLPAFIDAAWPVVATGGCLVLANCLLDGTIADKTRTDKATALAREADEKIRSLDNAQVTRLPLGAGLTIAVKSATKPPELKKN